MEYSTMIEVFDFLRDNNLLTPGVIAVAVAAVTWQLSKAIKQMQVELKEVAHQTNETSANLRTTAAILERIDMNGTKAELRRLESQIGRWEAAHERIAR